nr:NAD(P)-binding domain-containing protein [Azospirillum argentinense]
MMTVGFIGLGSMGMPMACNLLARGFALRGFDVRRESVAALEARGGRGRTAPPPPPKGPTRWS